MTGKASRALAVVISCLALTVAPGASDAAEPTVVANWPMDEPAGSQVMVDSAGDHDGVVDPIGVTANGSFYHWKQRCPSCPPVAPERVILVPDDPDLDIADPAVTFTVEVRYRTRGGYGNILQKGQSATAGGQVKIQLPKGRPQCLFKGANGVRVGSGSSVAINDGQWHTVRCVHTSTQVLTFVDGVRKGLKNGATGPINNSKAFAIGGKPSCDQGKTTCDYFSGDIDWVRVTRG